MEKQIAAYVSLITPDINKIKWPKFENKKTLIDVIDGMEIYLVDGNQVKIKHDPDFVEGGNDKVKDYIPKEEIWIDGFINEKNGKPVVLHELAERKLMSHGMGYEKAHSIANDYEIEYRKTHSYCKASIDYQQMMGDMDEKNKQEVINVCNDQYGGDFGVMRRELLRKKRKNFYIKKLVDKIDTDLEIIEELRKK